VEELQLGRLVTRVRRHHDHNVLGYSNRYMQFIGDPTQICQRNETERIGFFGIVTLIHVAPDGSKRRAARDSGKQRVEAEIRKPLTASSNPVCSTC